MKLGLMPLLGESETHCLKIVAEMEGYSRLCPRYHPGTRTLVGYPYSWLSGFHVLVYLHDYMVVVVHPLFVLRLVWC